MTRHELNTELKKLERYIDIYKTLISDSLCDCIAHIQDKYIELNKSELEYLLRRRSTLIPLKNESDKALANIPYMPVHLPC